MSIDDGTASRRAILRVGASMAGVTLLGTETIMAQTQSRGDENMRQPQVERDGEHEGQEEEISPGEDLMREHGVLKRILLVYEESERRLLAAGTEVSPDALRKAAALIRSFIEDYHEKLEEDFLFPRYRKANKLVDLVDVLVEQHKAGRVLTDRITRLATGSSVKDAANRQQLATALRQFVRMYAPHEAREDTVLFPALRKIVSANEIAALGEDFEKKEHELFGDGGFEEIVEKVAGIEKELGIYELSQFTPRT
ncbi:MAG: hemerythrin domain-containing protein [Phycisphaerales bacterium]|nr:hemerythrin domain-containing protein [Phycisphaerales bacterium]